MAGQSGEHEPEAVQKFAAGPEGAADAGDSRALVEGQSRRHVEHVVHISFGRLGHPAPCVGGEGVQIPPGSFRVEDTQGQGGFAGAGHAGDPHDFVQRDIYIYIFQIVNPGAPDLHLIDHLSSFPF